MKKGTPLFDRHSRAKKIKPPAPPGKENVEGKILWMKEQRAFLLLKSQTVLLTLDERRWLDHCEDRLVILNIASA